MVNLDELGTGNMKGMVLQYPHLRPMVQTVLDQLGDGLKCHVLAQMDPSTDSYSFSERGIPASILWRWRFVGRHPDAEFRGESSDTADKVRPRELREYAGMLSRILLRLSHIPPEQWPEHTLDIAEIRARVKAEAGTVMRTM